MDRRPPLVGARRIGKIVGGHGSFTQLDEIATVSSRDGEREAAGVLRDCRAALAARGSALLREAAGLESGQFVDWRHYPEGEAYDPATHVQYFYHRHSPAPAAAAGPTEHGHFHLFLRGEGIPAGMAPLLLPEAAVANAPVPRQSTPLKRGGRDEVCHLVAIALDAGGEPIRLFTTNRWVTGETWYRADDVIGMLDRFRIGTNEPSALLNRWLEAMVRLFQPEITVLLRNRDRAIVNWRWRWPRRNAFEDTRLEVASSFDIDLEARLAAIEARVDAPSFGPRRNSALPTMADGWGA